MPLTERLVPTYSSRMASVHMHHIAQNAQNRSAVRPSYTPTTQLGASDRPLDTCGVNFEVERSSPRVEHAAVLRGSSGTSLAGSVAADREHGDENSETGEKEPACTAVVLAPGGADASFDIPAEAQDSGERKTGGGAGSSGGGFGAGAGEGAGEGAAEGSYSPSRVGVGRSPESSPGGTPSPGGTSRKRKSRNVRPGSPGSGERAGSIINPFGGNAPWNVDQSWFQRTCSVRRCRSNIALVMILVMVLGGGAVFSAIESPGFLEQQNTARGDKNELLEVFKTNETIAALVAALARTNTTLFDYVSKKSHVFDSHMLGHDFNPCELDVCGRVGGWVRERGRGGEGGGSTGWCGGGLRKTGGPAKELRENGLHGV